MSTYQYMDHAAWMERQNAALNTRRGKRDALLPEKLTPFQARVVDIVGMVGGGIYNAPICQPRSINWAYGGRGVSLTWDRELASFDFNQLTLLVFLCHEARIRVEVISAGPKRLRLSFWQRVSPEENGNMACYHPSLDEAVAWFRQYLPADHRIIYTKPDEVYESEPQPAAGPAGALITEQQREFARHALGLPNRANFTNRNHFCVTEGCTGYSDWEDLVAKGLAGRQGDGQTFYLTLAGARAVLLPEEHISQQDAENMRSWAATAA